MANQVSSVLSLTKNGVLDWLVQRVTAVILGAYSVVMVAYLLLQPELDFATWKAFMATTWMQVFTLLAVISTCAHAWVGMWTVGSDYLREHLLGARAKGLRFTYQLACLLVTIVYLVWGIKILWG